MTDKQRREKAMKTIDDLYGLHGEHSYVEVVVGDMGAEAFSTEALEEIAAHQHNFEIRLGERMERDYMKGRR